MLCLIYKLHFITGMYVQEEAEYMQGSAQPWFQASTLGMYPPWVSRGSHSSVSLTLQFRSIRSHSRASLVAQWLRICLPMQGARVRALVWEDATEQLRPWATTTEPARLEPVLHNKRGRDNERPVHCDEEWPPLAATTESPRTENKDPTQP